MSRVVLIGVSLAIGLGLGTALDRSLLSTPRGNAEIEASAGEAIPSAPLQGTVAAPGTAVSLDIEPIRAMLREELTTALAKAQSASQSRSTPAEAPAAVNASVSPQQQRDALQAAEALVASGRWGDEERIGFHKKLAMLTPDQREQAMQQLMQAFNSGALRPSNSGPLF